MTQKKGKSFKVKQSMSSNATVRERKIKKQGEKQYEGPSQECK